MNVTLYWSEEVSYITDLTLDETEVAAFKDWLLESDPDLNVADYQVTPEDLRDWLVEEDWFGFCDSVRDFGGVDDRSLDRVLVRRRSLDRVLVRRGLHLP